MENKLVVPGGFKPSNLILPAHMTGAMVEGDLYDICERVKEIDRNLLIVPLEDDPEGYRYYVAEKCEDGYERAVTKCFELDARVLNYLRMLMAMPLSERLAKIEKDERRFEAQQHEEQLDDLYERVGRQMWIDLDKCGFIENRPVSYPKRGVTKGSDKG